MLHVLSTPVVINATVAGFVVKLNLKILHLRLDQWDSSVGIATRYELDGPGNESRWGARFSAPVQGLGPIQPPVQWVPGHSRG